MLIFTQLRRLAIATAVIWIGGGASVPPGGRHHPDHSGRAHARRIVPIRLRHGRIHASDLDEHRGLQLICEYPGGWRDVQRIGGILGRDRLDSLSQRNR